jgi:uncharacterized protein
MLRRTTALFVFVLTGSSLAAAPAAPAPPPPAWRTPVKNRAPLRPAAFTMLPLGSVKPTGWLRRQLEIQADGLTGHLDEFWKDVGPESAWLGGAGEGWERGPYFLDGLTPLAYLLDNPRLVAKVQKWVNWTLTHQRPDGYIGPEKNNGWWPRMIMLKVLAQYYEATGDQRVIPVLSRYFDYQRRTMATRPLETWARHRWGDQLLVVLWLYNRTGDAHLLELAHMLHDQGFDWKRHFTHFNYPNKMAKADCNQDTHVVNNAMSLKTFTAWWQVSGDQSDRASLTRELEVMDRYHGLPNGVHSGDEHYAGLSPSQGTELCAVVEAMFSLENDLAILGDAHLGDRLEKMAFNPLPGAFSGDMWSHQYDQQPNQVLCDINPRQWTNNGPESNLFGLEPNFGCCTSNLHQGWPKFAANLWMATPGGGLAAVAYAPSEATTTVRGGVPVTIREQTEYPFRSKIAFTILPRGPARFPLVLRIPSWAAGATVRVNGRALAGDAPVRPGAWHTIDRLWRAGDQVELDLPMAVRVSRWYNNSVAIERGPLVYSLRIGEQWNKLRDKSPAADWEVKPTTAWNYALALDPAQPDKSVEVVELPLGALFFSPQSAPVELRVKARKLPAWNMANGSAAPPPQSPVSSAEPVETVTLVPYGAAKLRITAFPLLQP